MHAVQNRAANVASSATNVYYVAVYVKTANKRKRRTSLQTAAIKRI